jgi:hypothetical protein
MPQSITPERRLAIIALARISGAADAAKAGKVDVRTVRVWLEEEGDRPHDAHEWRASRLHAMAENLRAQLSGKARDAYEWVKSAGVSSRNERYADLIARREARREEAAQAAEPNAVHVQIDRLDDLRRRYLREEIDAVMLRRGTGAAPKPDGPAISDDEYAASLAEYVDELLALSDDEVQARLDRLEAESGAVWEAEAEARNAELAARFPPPEPPAEPEAGPEPPEPVVRPSPRRTMHVVDDNDHPSWEPMYRGDLT